MNEKQQEAARQALKIITMPRVCSECGRKWDFPYDETDESERIFGHDCE